MPILIAKKLTLSPVFLAQAIVAKTTSQFATESEYRGISYEKEIYPQARFAFEAYNKRYPHSNEEFVKYFARDFNNKDKRLLEIISKESTKTGQVLVEQTTTQPAGQVAGGEPVGTMAGGSHLPSISLPTLPTIHNIPQVNPSNIPSKTPVPDAFNKAFENEPEYKTDPTKSAPKAGKTSFQPPRIPASFTNVAKNFGSRAGIFFKKNSGRIAGGLGQIAKGIGRGIAGPGLTGAYNLLGRAGTGGINAFANLSNQVAGRGALVKGSSKKIALAFLGALFLFVFGAGLLGGITGTTPIGETSPIPIGTDISSCKFTRAGSSLPVKSSILLGWINNAAASSGIPPQILASVAMHENQDFVAGADDNHDSIKSNQFCNRGIIFCEKSGQVLHSKDGQNDPCTPEEISDGAKTAQAVGLMQLLDIYNQGKGDLCSITNNLAIAAAKLKTDGITSQPTQDQVNKAINSYYNSCTYGSYSYCNEVWQDIQNCQQTTAPPPPADGDLKQAINDEFGIDFQGSEFTADHLQAAWEILNQAEQVAPRFFGLLGRGIIADTHSDVSERVDRTIYFSTRANSFFMTGSPQQFKVLLIHELGHIIRGDPGSTKANSYDQQLQSAVNKDGGYLTGYGENPCYGTPGIDEDFSETVTYYVNKGAKEEDLGCGVKSTDGINPLESGLYPAHLDFIQTELGKP